MANRIICDGGDPVTPEQLDAMGLRWCTFHKKVEAVSGFGPGSGRGRLCTECREGAIERNRRRRIAKGLQVIPPKATDHVVVYTGPKITPEEAKSQSAKRYFTGDPCRRGHIDQRMVISGVCVSCRDEKNDPEYHRTYRAKNPKAANERNRVWRSKNPDYMKGYRTQNREQVNENNLRWQKANPDCRRATKARRRARERGGSITVADIKDVLGRQRHRCGYCRIDLRKSGYHVDHIVPLAGGGSNVRKNIQALCGQCNRRKSARDPIEFAQAIGLLL